jgi:hypothetical protein
MAAAFRSRLRTHSGAARQQIPYLPTSVNNFLVWEPLFVHGILRQVVENIRGSRSRIAQRLNVRPWEKRPVSAGRGRVGKNIYDSHLRPLPPCWTDFLTTLRAVSWLCHSLQKCIPGMAKVFFSSLSEMHFSQADSVTPWSIRFCTTECRHPTVQAIGQSFPARHFHNRLRGESEIFTCLFNPLRVGSALTFT